MSTPLSITVLVCAHNPHEGRFARVLGALGEQTLGAARWSLLVVDNASSPPLAERPLAWPANTRVIVERELGLTAARLAGIAEARGEVVVLIDDDTVPAPDYLEVALGLMESHAEIGAAGGRIRGEFAAEPPPWSRNFLNLLAIRDFGDLPIRALARNCPGPWEPCGAGMVVRGEVARHYADMVRADPMRRLDRVGTQLSSCGDTDLARTATDQGLYLAYEPRLHLTHIIPPARLGFRYIARLAYCIERDAWLLLRMRGLRCEVRGAGLWLRRLAAPLRALRADPREWALRAAAAWGQLAGRSLKLEPRR